MATKTNSKNSVVFYGTDETDFLTNSGNNVTIISYAGNDTINVTSSESSRYSNNIQAGSGDNFINNSNVMQSTITAGTGNDTIITGGYYSTINAGDGRNKIYVGDSYYNYKNTIISGSGADLISISGSSYENSIIAGEGNNTIYGGLGSNNTVTAGAGDDKVTVGGSSYVNVGNGKNNISISSGSNVKIISGGGSDIINVASSKSRRYSNLIYAGAGNNFINNSNVMQSTITAGTGNDTITTGGYY